MLLNTDKTKLMLITSRQKRATMENSSLFLKYNDLDQKLTNADKILGVHINENLTWNAQFQFIVKKVSSQLWILSRISSYLSVEDRLLFYNAYIRPNLDYCSIIWGISTSYT